MKFPIEDLFIKCDHIHSFLQICSHLLKKSSIGRIYFMSSTLSGKPKKVGNFKWSFCDMVNLKISIQVYFIQHCTKKFSIKDFFSKYDQIHSFLRIWSHLLKKSLMENSIFCAVPDLSS